MSAGAATSRAVSSASATSRRSADALLRTSLDRPGHAVRRGRERARRLDGPLLRDSASYPRRHLPVDGSSVNLLHWTRRYRMRRPGNPRQEKKVLSRSRPLRVDVQRVKRLKHTLPHTSGSRMRPIPIDERTRASSATTCAWKTRSGAVQEPGSAGARLLRSGPVLAAGSRDLTIRRWRRLRTRSPRRSRRGVATERARR